MKINTSGIKLFLISLSVFLSDSQLYAQYFETSVNPSPGDQYKSARYRMWIPEGVKNIRGILIRQHGCGEEAIKNGLIHANDLQWQALAKKHQMALLGTELRNFELCAQWVNINGGSDIALLKALKTLGRQSNHPEIATAPWALWGHSGGGFWSTNMLLKYPERILLVIARSGGYSFMQWNPKVIDVPCLWAAGINDVVGDLEYAKTMTIKSFQTYRSRNAPWSLAIDPKADHGNRLGRSFYIPYMDVLLSMRLPKDGIVPRPVDTTQVWLGHPSTLEIKPLAEVKTKATSWIWLPNESLAKKWREFVKTGWVTDHTAPEAPENVLISKDRKELQWKINIDLESGLKLIKIYENDLLIDSLKGQKSNYSDAPDPVEVKSTYRLTRFKNGDKYQVSVVNHQGLESKKSKRLFY